MTGARNAGLKGISRRSVRSSALEWPQPRPNGKSMTSTRSGPSKWREYLDNLGVLRTKPLVTHARKWEVEIPPEAWVHDRSENYRYISPREQVKLRRRIRDARREAVRWWVQVLTPPLSLIVALLALLTRKCCGYWRSGSSVKGDPRPLCLSTKVKSSLIPLVVDRISILTRRDPCGIRRP